MSRRQNLLLVTAFVLYSLSAVVIAFGQHVPETRLVRVEQRFIPATQHCSIVPGGELVEVVTSLQRHPETGTFWRWSPAAHHHRAAVRIIAGNGAGSGVCVATDTGKCLVLTNQHVVESHRVVTVSWPFGGAKSRGQVIAVRMAGQEDVAAILVEQPDPGWIGLPIAAATPPVGAELEMVGFGGPQYGQIRAFVAQRLNGSYRLQIDAPTISGDSGSGILFNGQVVGVNWGGPAATAAARSSSGRPIPLVYPATSSVNAEFLQAWLTQSCGPFGCRPRIGGQSPNYPPQQSPGAGGDGQFYPPNYSSPPTAPAIPQPPAPTQPPTQPPSGNYCMPCKPIDVDDLRAEIIKDVLAQIPKARDGKDGRDGVDGKDGRDGTVTQAHMDAIVSAVAAKIPPQLPSRIVIVDGATKQVLDDETYAPGEPIVIDFQRVINAAKPR